MSFLFNTPVFLGEFFLTAFPGEDFKNFNFYHNLKEV